ncbi:MAG: C40 family peptidase [Fibromonadaceae bacterium]|jgi:cell wall-associated NlpC family hydrolase|nr:C40 family peptidase [Fibromonadaceae bacterium]
MAQNKGYINVWGRDTSLSSAVGINGQNDIDQLLNNAKKLLSSVTGITYLQEAQVGDHTARPTIASLTSGRLSQPQSNVMDCSSYVRWVFGQTFGINIGLNTRQQFGKLPLVFPIENVPGCTAPMRATKAVPDGQQMPGDLVFFYSISHMNRVAGNVYGVYHVGIYAGEGRMFHTGVGSRVSNISVASFKRYSDSIAIPTTFDFRRVDMNPSSTESSEEDD